MRNQAGSREASTPRQVEMTYRYTNTAAERCELWLALPPELPTQRAISVAWTATQPNAIEPDGNGLNRLAYFELARGQTVAAAIRAELHTAPNTQTEPLAEDQRAHYTRQSSLITFDDALRDEARQLTTQADNDEQRIRALAHYVIDTCSYRWPPERRGVAHMRVNRSGDCGEYSFLLAAYCRSLGIPCRVLVGSFASGRMGAHVWNECWIDGTGWFYVDTTLAQQMRRSRFARAITMVAGVGDLHFGVRQTDRLVFSLDPDVPLRPTYASIEAPDGAPVMTFGDRAIAWGFASLDGDAPYLQPAYPRLTGVRDISALNDAAALGDWRFKRSGRETLASLLFAGGAAIAIGSALARSLFNVTLAPPFNLLGSVGGALLLIALFLRAGKTRLRWLWLALLTALIVWRLAQPR
jgi:hypothetical protein